MNSRTRAVAQKTAETLLLAGVILLSLPFLLLFLATEVRARLEPHNLTRRVCRRG